LKMERAQAEKEANVTITQAYAKARAMEIEAAANKDLLSDEYLKLKATEAFHNNNKVVMGDSIPQSWLNFADNILK